MVHSLSITPLPEFAQRPSAKHQSDACCSLSLRVRVRVRRKHSVEQTTCSRSRRLLSIAFLRVATVTLSLVLSLFAAGCQTASSLRDAPDTFNRAAAAENTLRSDLNEPLHGGGADTMIGLGAVRSGYASALVVLNRITTESAAKLRNDQLLGDALTLKALCEWRLGQFSNAVATAQSAQSAAADQLFPRDRALLRALPGLIKTDQAYQKIMERKPLAEIEQLLVSGNGAVADLQTAREGVDRDHPVQIFLLQAQLAAYRNFTVVEFRLNNNATVPVEHPARTRANTQLKELDRLCKAASVGPNLVNYWQKLCAPDFP